MILMITYNYDTTLIKLVYYPVQSVHRPSTTPDGYERTSILIVILHGKQYIRQYTNVSYNDW